MPSSLSATVPDVAVVVSTGVVIVEDPAGGVVVGVVPIVVVVSGGVVVVVVLVGVVDLVGAVAVVATCGAEVGVSDSDVVESAAVEHPAANKAPTSDRRRNLLISSLLCRRVQRYQYATRSTVHRG